MCNEFHKVDSVVHAEVVWEEAYRLDGSKIPLLERGLVGFRTGQGDRAHFSGWLYEMDCSSENRKTAGRKSLKPRMSAFEVPTPQLLESKLCPLDASEIDFTQVTLVSLRP